MSQREWPNRVGFGTFGKDEKASIRVLIEHTQRGWRLILEDADDGRTLVMSPHSLRDFIGGLEAAEAEWHRRRKAQP